MNRNRHEVGRRQGGQPYITFGYHRRPPARTRARGRRPDLRAAAPAADPGKRGKRKGHEQPFNDEDWCPYVQPTQAYSAGDEQA